MVKARRFPLEEARAISRKNILKSLESRAVDSKSTPPSNRRERRKAKRNINKKPK